MPVKSAVLSVHPSSPWWAGRGSWARPALLARFLLVALAALALGLLVTLTDRPPGHAQALPAFLHLPGGPWFGALGGWLPSFVHVLAFSLLTAALLPTGRAGALAACAGWWAVNLGFEFAQHPWLREPLMQALQTPPTGPLSALPSVRSAVLAYLHGGRFDVGDLAAATLGALVAAALLWPSGPPRQQESHHVTS